MRTSLSFGFTVRQAAWLLGVDPATVHRAIRVGTLPLVRRRGRYVIPAHALVRLLVAPRTGGTP
ncbi:helix-turn-helix domain-containing protein [Saccharothrix obliqua]|uniref:helix-turn-helix domain-containing protein n=1 Tax=Saccharothrix obliqua TaxID=2861747 RepID=UPI001C5E7630|nr:helix-turn-helix domain-containing protein [Saccharothrix obliqua]MBW4717886.1 helix-turn-helix domain-containing protein [Saccharothrix obliqua]